MNEILKAIYEHGSNIIGYAVWSLMDNFELFSGFSWVSYMLIHYHNEKENLQRWNNQKSDQIGEKRVDLATHRKNLPLSTATDNNFYQILTTLVLLPPLKDSSHAVNLLQNMPSFTSPPNHSLALTPPSLTINPHSFINFNIQNRILFALEKQLRCS